MIRVSKLPVTHPLRERGEYVTLDNRRLVCFRIALKDLENSNEYTTKSNKFKIPVEFVSYEKTESTKTGRG